MHTNRARRTCQGQDLEKKPGINMGRHATVLILKLWITAFTQPVASNPSLSRALFPNHATIKKQSQHHQFLKMQERKQYYKKISECAHIRACDVKASIFSHARICAHWHVRAFEASVRTGVHKNSTTKFRARFWHQYDMYPRPGPNIFNWEFLFKPCVTIRPTRDISANVLIIETQRVE